MIIMEGSNGRMGVKLNSVVVRLVLITFVIISLGRRVSSLDTKYFKRFYFGNLSMDLTEELGERFNYDYHPQQQQKSSQQQPSSSKSSSQQSSNAYHTIHVKQSSSPLFHLHHNNNNNNDHSNNINNNLIYMSSGGGGSSGSSVGGGSSDNNLNLNHHSSIHRSSSQQSSSSSSSSSGVQGDQPHNNTGNNNNNNDGGTTAPPPPQTNQPYRHQDLKALSKNITNILNSFNVSYDKRVRPNYGGEAVEVGITMFVLSISDLSEVEMDFTLDFYFRQMWKDHRLTFQGPKGVNTLSVSSEFLKSMWVPDTFFVNEKTSYFHTATTNNEFLRISQTGDILRSMRLTVCASCPMDLRHFPMDSQLCTIEIESFGYTMSDLRYKWAAGAVSVGMANDVSLPQFKVYGYRQKTYEISLSSGNYSRLACEIQFVRSMGYYLIQIYIPSSLIVVISWVSFWLNRNAAPARVYLGITTVLTMTTLMSSTNKALPKISYVKSIDVYLGTCFVMVFAALLEYATVGYLAKRIQMRKNHFAALQKMALQLQNAREEHVQKQYPQQQQQQQAPPPQQPQPLPPQTPSHHHHHHHHQGGGGGAPQTPHTPRYSQQQMDHQQQQHAYPTTPSSTRFLESTSTNTLRKYTTNNNAQYISSQQQQQQQPQHIHHQSAGGGGAQGLLGSTASIIPPAYYNTQQGQQPRGSSAQAVYDQTRYYDAQAVYTGGSNSIPPPVAYAQQQQPYYGQQNATQQQQHYYSSRGGDGSSSWGESGSCSRGASVKRRGGGGQSNNPDTSSEMGYQPQNLGGIPPSLLQQSLVQQQQQNVYGQQPQPQQAQQFQQYGQAVGSVIGTTASIEQHQTQQQQQQQPPQPPQSSGGDKIRQLIPINPNQICGITPSDIDKYSRVVFPVCFVCFNLLYWIIYLHISNVNPTTDLVIVNSDA